MSLVRRNTNDSSKSTVEKSYSNILTPYAYRYLEEEIRKVKRIAILKQIDHQTYLVYVGGHWLFLTAHICPYWFMKQMGLPCQHIFKLRSYLYLSFIDAELVNERWTVEYYKTLSHTRFSPPQANDKCSNVNVPLSEAPPETKKATLTQVQKYHNKSVSVHW